MKNYIPTLTALVSLFSIHCFAQKSSRPISEEVDAVAAKYDSVIVSYHVEERINMTFGGRISTYDVKSLSLVATNDLGPNNTRTVTPKYVKIRKKTDALKIQPAGWDLHAENPVALTDVVIPTKPFTPQIKTDPVVAEAKPVLAYINKTDTYERILNKGYRSVELLKRVANSRFFDGDLAKAAKWYSELFAMTTDLDDVYYYRYAQSLKSIRQEEKANEMIAMFESKTAKKPLDGVQVFKP